MTEADKNNFDTADDLLEELQELESSTASMEKSVEQASKKHEELSNSPNPSTIDAAALSLEAAKTSQQAASQSQSAAEAAIKLSYEQKNQVMELTDSNLSWRQTLRSANKELESSKSTFTIMLVIGIIVSLVATGAMGFLFYTINKKNEMMKGDVLDIITTETNLFNKQMTLKIDQMSALIEAMAADVQRLPISPPVSSKPTPSDQSVVNAASQDSTHEEAKSNSEEHSEPMPHKTELTENHNNQTVEKNAITHDDQPKHSEASDKAAEPVREVVHREVIENKVVVDDKAIKAQVQKLADEQKHQLEKIEKLIAQLAEKQANMKIESQTPQVIHSKTVTAPVEVTSMGLTESQVKKLNNISWAVHKQSKTLKEIQSLLKSKTTDSKKMSQQGGSLKAIQTSLNELNQQMSTLKNQQQHLQKEVEALKEETQKLASKPDPYSYKARELPVQ